MTRSIRNFVGFAVGLIIVAFFAVSMQGCKYLESPAAQPFDAIAVAVAVDTVAGTNTVTVAARASAIKAIAQDVLAADTGTVVTIDGLLALATGKVAALKLPPGDAAAAQLFLAVIESAINQYVTTLQGGQSVSNVQTSVATVAGWVIAECTRLGAP